MEVLLKKQQGQKPELWEKWKLRMWRQWMSTTLSVERVTTREGGRVKGEFYISEFAHSQRGRKQKGEEVEDIRKGEQFGEQLRDMGENKIWSTAGQVALSKEWGYLVLWAVCERRGFRWKKDDGLMELTANHLFYLYPSRCGDVLECLLKDVNILRILRGLWCFLSSIPLLMLHVSCSLREVFMKAVSHHAMSQSSRL